MQEHGDRQTEGIDETPSDGGGENRREHRRRTLKQARAVLSDTVVIDCKLRDLSQEGAHLVFGGAVSLPEEFRLFNVSDKQMTPVRLEWQRGLEAGVSFAGPSEPHANL